MEILDIAGCIILDDYGRLLLVHHIGSEETFWDIPTVQVAEDESTESAAVRASAEQLAVEVKLVGSPGSELVEGDDMAYRYHWFQAIIERGQAVVADPDTANDFDYFELEDMPSLALSSNVLTLYPKIYSGEILLDSSL